MSSESISISPAEAEPTLLDVTEYREKVLLFIANCRLVGVETEGAFEAVERLTRLARMALSGPQPKDLRWALMNDPYARAAYEHGARTAREATITPEEISLMVWIMDETGARNQYPAFHERLKALNNRML